jgi:UDP-N-acetyl-2-amino-2-deoxyglucuronate dehydrogenase
MKKWNIGIVGAGVIADFHAKALGEIENAQLAGICDINGKKAAEFGQRYNCPSFESLAVMLKNGRIDILSIATPSGLHMDAAIEAAQHGVHTLVEKPLEISGERIDKMIQAHQKAGKKLGCIFQTRYAAALDPLREAIKSRRFGKITFVGVFVPWWRTDEYYKNSWHGTWKIDGGGALMNQTIHMIDTLCELLPDIESVQGLTSSIGHSGIEAEDAAVACLKFADGALGIIHGSTACYPGHPKRLEIMGTEGTVVYLEDSYTVFDFKDKKESDQQVLDQYGKMNFKSGFSDPKAISHLLHAACFKDFIDCVENNKEFKVGGLEARKSVHLIESIYTSAKENRIVKL